MTAVGFPTVGTRAWKGEAVQRSGFERRFLAAAVRRLPSVTRRALVAARRSSPLRAREIEDAVLRGRRAP